MKNLILICAALLTGCSTLGFGDFSYEIDEVKTDKVEKMDKSLSGKIPVIFTYQPLIGGKHEVFLAGDFNNWSQTATLLLEVDGVYKKPGRNNHKI